MKTSVKISKTALLEATNQGLNFYSFVIPHLKKFNEDSCENTYNPFYPDKNPDFSIYFSKEFGRWMFKDHGGSPDGKEYSGDVFNFAKLYCEAEGQQLKFGQLLSKMVEDLGIDPARVEDKTAKSGLCSTEEVDHVAWSIGFDLLPNFNRSTINRGQIMRNPDKEE